MTTGTGSFCDACGIEILYALDETNERVPIETLPIVDGNVELVGDPVSTAGRATLRAKHLGPLELSALDADTHRYRDHRDNCPRPEIYRKPRRTRRSGSLA